MITLEKIKSKKEIPNYKLCIDNEVFKSGRRTPVTQKNRLIIYVAKSLEIEVDVKDTELIEKIIEHRFSELPNELTRLMLESEFMSLEGDLIEPIRYLFLERTDEAFRLSCSMHASSETWHAPFPHAEFMVEYYKRLRILYPTEFEKEEPYVTVSSIVKDLEVSIKSEVIALRSKVASRLRSDLGIRNSRSKRIGGSVLRFSGEHKSSVRTISALLCSIPQGSRG